MMIELHYWTTPNGHKITIAARINTVPTMTEGSKRHLFDQSAASVQGRA